MASTSEKDVWLLTMVMIAMQQVMSVQWSTAIDGASDSASATL
jgi:hypothetical protein